MRGKSKLVLRGIPAGVTQESIDSLLSPCRSLISYVEFRPAKVRPLADACRMGVCWINFGPGAGWEAAMHAFIEQVQEGRAAFRDDKDREVQPTVEWFGNAHSHADTRARESVVATSLRATTLTDCH